MDTRKKLQTKEIVFGTCQESVPPGKYKAKFLGIETTKPHPKYGSGLKFWWEITEGPWAGREVSRLVGGDRAPTKLNALGRFLIAMSGQDFEEGETVDWTDFVGRIYTVTVEAQDDGIFTRVAAVLK